MNYFGLDGNHNPTQILEGPPRGGVVNIAATPAGSWSRVMPARNDGALVVEADDARYASMLKIGHADGASGDPLRGIQKGKASGSTTRYSLDLHGWRLRILNTGYEQSFRVEVFENATGRVLLNKKIEHRDALPAAIEWVLFPTNILPIVLHNIGARTIDVGIVTDPMSYTTNNNNVLKLAQLRQHASMSIPSNACDQICVQRESGTGGIVFSWVEGGVGDYR